MQNWIKEIEYNKEDEQPEPIKEYYCCFPQFKYTETCMLCGETYYTLYEIKENGGIVERVCENEKCNNKFREIYRNACCSACYRYSISLSEDYTREQTYEEYTKEEWDKKRDETTDFCPLCGRTYNHVRNCVICGKQFKTNYDSMLVCRNKKCKGRYSTWKKKSHYQKKKKIRTCKVEGCNNVVYNRYKDLCFEHYKNTSNIPYADDIFEALKQWLSYEGYDIIVDESKYFDVVACRKKEYPTGEIIGIEIKSDHDSYELLPKQLPRYLDVFDKVYLCLDNKKTYNYPSVGILRFDNGQITVEKEPSTYTKDSFSQYDIEQLLKKSDLSILKARKIIHNIELFEKIQRKIKYISLFKNACYIEDLTVVNDEEIKFLKHLVNF